MEEADVGLGPRDELATVIRECSTLGLGWTKEVSEVLRPAEAARRLGVPTRDVIQAMYEKQLPRVRLSDGTLGVPAGSLDTFPVPAA
jgi:hypothetical protein